MRQVINDVKSRENINGTIEYTANVIQSSDSYPFGWDIKERSFSTDLYRYSFNGKENDTDWGNQHIQDYGFRLYNPALAKFLSVDPLAPEYPWYTPYQFAGNMPIVAIDLDGLEPQITNGSEFGGDASSATDHSGESVATVTPDMNVQEYGDMESVEGEAPPQTFSDYQRKYPEFANMNHSQAKARWEQKYRSSYVPSIEFKERKIIDDFRFLAQSGLRAGAGLAKCYIAGCAIALTGGVGVYATGTYGSMIPLFVATPALMDASYQLGTTGRLNPFQSIGMGVFKNPGAAIAFGQSLPFSIGRGGFKFDGYDLNRSATLITAGALVGKFGGAAGTHVINLGGNASQQTAHNFLGKWMVPIISNVGADRAVVSPLATFPHGYIGDVDYSPLSNWK
ncbi:RHS repeat domain-containing protein [Aureispira anguillae]|uniref:RHS repeat domain-containing protein n=1 Tax=Aureispira anguillae TaxID=2864201 RepID=UPI00222FBAF4|nr:RHS repeat-associated core domain-containing protein [Aureispira anguillae]